MRISTNKLASIREFYINELSDLCNKHEAETLFYFAAEEIMQLKRFELLASLQKGVSESVLLKFFNVYKRLKKAEPIQYIFKKAYFYGYEFKVSESVLIPRGETEELVQHAIKKLKNKEGQLKILDLCTGSGCIAITLAKEIRNAEVYAIDISEKALEIANANNKLHSTNVIFLQADVNNIANVREALGDVKFDIILSNPPYVRNLEKALMRENVLCYEPGLALFVEDNNALIFYKNIANIAKEYLEKEASVIVEINEALSEETMDCFAQKGFIELKVNKDLHDKCRFVEAVRFRSL